MRPNICKHPVCERCWFAHDGDGDEPDICGDCALRARASVEQEQDDSQTFDSGACSQTFQNADSEQRRRTSAPEIVEVPDNDDDAMQSTPPSRETCPPASAVTQWANIFAKGLKKRELEGPPEARRPRGPTPHNKRWNGKANPVTNSDGVVTSYLGGWEKEQQSDEDSDVSDDWYSKSCYQ